MNETIPIGFCQCGCGGKTNISRQNTPRWGHVKGRPFKYLQGHTKGKNRGSKNHMWKGGKRISCGYVFISMPSHPRADIHGYVQEHILVAEKALGKPLPPKAVVHHANGTKNSGPLVICQDSAYHQILHRRMRAYRACGHANWLKCPYCKRYDTPEKMFVRTDRGSGGEGHHQSCSNLYRRLNKKSKPKETESHA